MKEKPSHFLCVLCQATFRQLCSFNKHKRELRCPELKKRRKEEECSRPSSVKKRGRGEVGGVRYCIILYRNHGDAENELYFF